MAVLRQFAQINRGPGRIVSQEVVVPDDATRAISVRALLSQALRDSTTTELTLGMEAEDANAPGGWRHITSTTFVGGPGQGFHGGNTPNPGFEMNLALVAGQTVRLFLDLPERIQVGGIVETVS